MSDQERAIVATVVARAGADPVVRDQLRSDPVGTLAAAGMILPGSARVQVLEDGANVVHVVVPRLSELIGTQKEQFVAALARLVPMPAGVEMHLHQETEDLRFVVLPAAAGPGDPGDDQLSDDALANVAGGMVQLGGNGGAGGDGPWLGVLGGNGGNGGNGGLGGLGGF